MTYPDHPGTSHAAVLCWRDGGVGHLRLNRPEALNTIDLALAQGFLAACQTLAQDPLVRCVVLSGEGRAFMAGGDLISMRADPLNNTRILIENMHAGLSLLGNMPVPVIASLHGAVAGGGLGLAVVADLAIAAEGTRFTLAYTRIGANTDCGTSWGLVRAVGMRKAMEIALLCEPFDVNEALRLGIVHRIVPAAELQAQTEKMARQLAEGPTLALGNLKRLIQDAGRNSLDEHLQAEAVGFAQCAKSGDFLEGVGAFLDKRTAQFTGR